MPPPHIKHELNFIRFIWIDTGCKWNANAEESIRGRSNFTRLNGSYFDAQRTDYRPLLEGRQTVEPPKSPRPHQIEAIEKTLAHFKENDRGQLIMACGTGKTLTSLRIAEAICAQPWSTKLVLYLVPSIALLGQAYNAWAADHCGDVSRHVPTMAADHAPLYAIGVCSDPHATEKRRKSTKDNLFDQTFDNLCDVPLSASTNPERVAAQLMAYYQAPRDFKEERMCVVFSTYQSIEVVEQAQKLVLEQTQNRFGNFEICFCDEAHRTTQACAKAESTPSFVHVHDENKIHIKKRLYMTATPRIYSESAKSNAKAKNSDVLIASMDDETVFGPEIHRISFNDAVQKGLLTDYKVIVLTASPKDLPESIHQRIDDPNAAEIDTDIATKLYGTTLALSKQITGDEGKTWQDDPQTCRRALLFANVIGDEELTGSSKNVSHIFESISDAVIAAHPDDHIVHVECQHVDGSMGANERYRLLEWLDAPYVDNM
ncbi:MAG: DEAD/DEAH box helicase family protein [Proteobacteria bacterium]|nr:DEAD/DEAH box helicase family protein [Pseudomonadota bacterium]